MKILFISAAVVGSLFFSSTNSIDEKVAEMPEMSVAIHQKGQEELIFLEAEKAFFTAGEKLMGHQSTFRVKGAEAPIKITSGEDLVFYVRGKMSKQNVPFTLAKMDIVKDKKRVIQNTPKNNPDNDIPIQRVGCDGSEVNKNLRIIKRIPSKGLEPGVYGVVFMSSTMKSFPMNAESLTTDVYSFEVLGN
ncbi:hypothetical protein ERX46_16150 [Brumimicrobium glaciale]|uniref:Uncharacterized protein n=1 Tax=Brumimicrobium glaciale TaxID=200475 RepID=A0A4Q4KFI8_9FLAO|nr:hypothetical protein [Brumimicrobium glaciale]RYM31440.1 hypothetical protein ERX46_16150 [Brumimicrobium glaciale]